MLHEAYLDAGRYFQAAEFPHDRQQRLLAHLESEIIRRYHVIEKGLSMPDFKPRSGIDMVTKLISCLKEWDELKRCSDGANQIESARVVLVAYARKHKGLGVDISDYLSDEVLISISPRPQVPGGTKSWVAVSEEDGAAFQRLAASRVSVRDFIADRIPARAVIQGAIDLAITSPSVCNRQTWRVHAYEGERAQEILSLQNGNRGFGHRIPTVLVVTSDMRFFTGTIERYQAWIDGGMFAMTLLLGLHSVGLGAVALNWSVRNEQDEMLRAKGGIPEHERVVMLIGCGYPTEGAVVANSLRRPAQSFIRWDHPAHYS